jgi:radical SAM protein with 4Fe4S-binding SPASM domain
MNIAGSCRRLAGLYLAKLEFDRQKVENELNYLFWECTLRCNLGCRHCGSMCSPSLVGKNDLSGDEAKRIFQEISQDFDASGIVIAVTGGEPLVREDVFDVMSTVAELGFYWGMVTNGTLITKNVIRKMEKSHMKTVSVSIDGNAEGHAALRGSREAYQKAIMGLNLLLSKASFLEMVEVVTVVHARNINILEDMYERFQSMGVERWRLLMIDPVGRMKEPDRDDLFLTGRQLAEMLEFVALKRRNGIMEITFEESGFLGLKYEGRVRDYYFHCPAGITTGGIMHDGAIGACPSLERHMVEGQARFERFSEVWRTRFQRYRDRESTRRKGPCAQCRWWCYCEGGSLHLWDWDEGKPRVCHYQSIKQAACV